MRLLIAMKMPPYFPTRLRSPEQWRRLNPSDRWCWDDIAKLFKVGNLFQVSDEVPIADCFCKS